MIPYEFCQFLVEAEALQKEGHKIKVIVEKLAPKYKVKPSTLRSRWYRHMTEKTQNEKTPNVTARLQTVRRHGKWILSAEEETALVTLLKVVAQTNHALKESDVIDYVRYKYVNNSASWRGDKFLKPFLKRNRKELHSANLKLTAATRVSEVSIESCNEFIEVMENTQNTIHMIDQNTLNVDEFQLKLSGYSGGRKRITAYKLNGSLHKQLASKKRGACVGSLIAFIAANGALVYSALCLKPDAKSNKPNLAYIDIDALELKCINTRKRPIPQLRIYSDSGMIDNSCWAQIWSGFIEFINAASPGVTKIVFMDNLPQHAQLDCIEQGLSNDVEIRFLPKGTSQFNQPCDSFVFGTLRKEMNKIVSSEMMKSENDSLNHIIRDFTPEALEKSFTPSLIKASFKETGLFPFNAETIRKRCQENLGSKSQDHPTNTLKAIEEKIDEQMKVIYHMNVKPKPKRKRVLVHLKQAYTSGHIVQEAKEQEKLKKEEQKLKQEKKEALEEKKRVAMIKKEEKGKIKEERKRKRDENKEIKEKAKIIKMAKKNEKKQKLKVAVPSTSKDCD